VSRESVLPVVDSAESEVPKAAASRWGWVFPVLIVIGTILVLASLVYLMQRQSAGHVPDACLVL
jgi:hypothetical protein